MFSTTTETISETGIPPRLQPSSKQETAKHLPFIPQLQVAAEVGAVDLVVAVGEAEAADNKNFLLIFS